MARLVLVHGSVANAEMTWGAVLPALRAQFEVVLHTRSGYPPREPRERIDFDAQAEELARELADGDHLVGHSYGGVVSMLAAASTDKRLGSLTVNEPPAFALASGNAAVEQLLATLLRAPSTPREYLEFFMPLIHSAVPMPDPLPPPLEAGARAAISERGPWEAAVPLDALAAAPYPKLVVSGGHSEAFDAVCDVLERSLHAKRLVLTGAGHSLPRAPGYAEALLSFLKSAS
jgi:pimeloyl-ACP methyl ester carboxylesterase